MLDLQMPEMDGLELARLLHGRAGQHGPLVLLTSVGWRPDGAEKLLAGCLAKPVKGRVLRDCLVAVLGRGAEAVPVTPAEALDRRRSR